MKKQPKVQFSFRAARLTGACLALLAAMSGLSAHAASQTPRIVGGSDTTTTEFPWQVAIVYDNDNPYDSLHCGGSIIHEKWILSAAHCADTLPTYVVVGAADLSNTADAQIIQVARWHAHPDFVDVGEATGDDITLDNDIALAELSTPIDFSACGSRCSTIELVTAGTEGNLAPPSTQALVSGWGSTASDIDAPEFPSILQQASVVIMDCSTSPALFESSLISPRMICASASDFSRDACNGDSGGPLVVANSSGTGYAQAGVVSWGTSEGCAVEGYPGVYARVSRFSRWIWDTTDGDCCTEPVVTNPIQELVDSDGGGGNGGALPWSLLLGLPLLALALTRRHGARA